MVPAARGVGFAQVIGTSSVVSYYCVLIALSIYYLVASCQATLPWTVCWEELKVGGICSLHGTQHICTQNYFQQNNTLCMEGGLARNVSNATSVGTVDVERINLVRCQFRNIYHYHSVCHNSLTYDLHSIQTIISSAEQYFKSSVLKENPDISNGIGMPDIKLVGSLAACWILLFLTLWKGVASSGKVSSIEIMFHEAVYSNVFVI